MEVLEFPVAASKGVFSQGDPTSHGFHGYDVTRQDRRGSQEGEEEGELEFAAGDLGADPSAAGDSDCWVRAVGYQPGCRTHPARLDEVSCRRRDWEAAAEAAASSRADGDCGDFDSGAFFFCADATAVEIGAADDHRFAQAGASAHWAAFGKFLRFEQNRSAGFADYERRGRGADPDRDGTGGICRRVDDGGA